MPGRKVQTNLRLTDRARRILARLSDAWGVSQADVIELILRQEEERQRGQKADTHR